MKKYAVYITIRDTAYVEVEAENEYDAEEKAYEAIESGDIQIDNPYDDPEYEFDIEEIKNEK